RERAGGAGAGRRGRQRDARALQLPRERERQRRLLVEDRAAAQSIAEVDRAALADGGRGEPRRVRGVEQRRDGEERAVRRLVEIVEDSVVLGEHGLAEVVRLSLGVGAPGARVPPGGGR